MIQKALEWSGEIGGLLWGPWTFFILMLAGILFTVWSRFTQYRSLTHGIAVIRGKYDDPDDPGAINHFQALSAALSATVGLGNISGVALAIAAGGPGALFWMWVIAVFGMALKTVEITLAMMYRNTDDPENPHGGAMWVVDKVLGSKGPAWKPIAKAIGIFFCITLLISSITGGNMFQSWSVADLTYTYWQVPKVVTGIILVIVVGLVIIGGIKRIGSVAGRLVPFMCILYVLTGLVIIVMEIGQVPSMLVLIVKSAFQPTEATGAFLGGSIGWAFSSGLRRALFSNEAGQGSAPIAHSAAKTDEAAREGIVGGIGPFIDTICICTLTALVILLTGTWNRDPLMPFHQPYAQNAVIAPVYEFDKSTISNPADDLAKGRRVWLDVTVPETNSERPTPSKRLRGDIERNGDQWVVAWRTYASFEEPVFASLDLKSRDVDTGEVVTVGSVAEAPVPQHAANDDGTPMWGLISRPRIVDVSDDNAYKWANISDVYTIVQGVRNPDANLYSKKTNYNRWELHGECETASVDSDEGNTSVTVEWDSIAMSQEPTLVPDAGMYRRYDGASLTAHAFDRRFPGLGRILVTIAAWLFAISTMISWSYYGEQGMVYMLGQRSVLIYKLCYLALAIVAAVWITDKSVMEPLMDLGTGAMLWSNIPIVVGCGVLAIRCLADYDGRLKSGEMQPHDAPEFEDVVSGRDVE